MENNKTQNRRTFIQKGVRLSLLLSLGTVSVAALRKVTTDDYVWQIDPFACTQCDRCATACVMKPSAVKCVHAYDLCGYCDLCGGYLKPDSINRDTAAENQLCPTAAIERRFIEEPYFEYHINEDLCIARHLRQLQRMFHRSGLPVKCNQTCKSKRSLSHQRRFL